MRLVVDASVAVKWLIAEDGSDAAALLLMDGDDLHAPRLMASEVANALWRKIRKDEIERGQVGVLTAAGDARSLERGRDGVRGRGSSGRRARPTGLRLHVSGSGASP